MRLVYEQAAVDSEGHTKFEVDHEIPLDNDENVCGLHCLANLRIVPRIVNRYTWSMGERRRVRR
jgi:hypothetical protein